jgi:hypothetical protein
MASGAGDRYTAQLGAASSAAGVRVIVEQALGDKAVFFVAHLLQHPALELVSGRSPTKREALTGCCVGSYRGRVLTVALLLQLKDSAEAGWAELLQIFAYGTYAQYKGE